MNRRCDEGDDGETTPDDSSPGSATRTFFDGPLSRSRSGRSRSRSRLGRAALLLAALATATAGWEAARPRPPPPKSPLLVASGGDPERGSARHDGPPPSIISSQPPSRRDDDGGCSCFRSDDDNNNNNNNNNSDGSAPCCQRAVLKNHKFGMVLTERLFRPFEGEVERIRRIETSAFPTDPATDYRHAVLVRNYLEALVSGYLYHRSGHECWLTLHGDPRTPELNADWDVYLNGTIAAAEPQFDIRPYPPRAGRSICRYLADEPDEVGMRVYIAVALRWWYSGLDDYHREVTERRAKGEVDRTLFLCLGDFPDPVRQERMFYRIMDWLYPGGHNHTVPPRAITAPPAHQGHASTGNSTVRRRLLDLVGRLDRDVFRNALSGTDARFGCKSTIRQIRRT